MKYQRIQDLREENQYKQDYVAHRLGISQRSYSYYERGERTIPLEILVGIADIYGVSTDYLLNRTKERRMYRRCTDRGGKYESIELKNTNHSNWKIQIDRNENR